MPDIEIHPDTVGVLKSRPGKVAVYRNQAFDSASFGHLKFLRIGEEWTFQEAPERLPDTPDQINWKYRLLGVVGVEDIPKDGKMEVG